MITLPADPSTLGASGARSALIVTWIGSEMNDSHCAAARLNAANAAALALSVEPALITMSNEPVAVAKDVEAGVTAGVEASSMNASKACVCGSILAQHAPDARASCAAQASANTANAAGSTLRVEPIITRTPSRSANPSGRSSMNHARPAANAIRRYFGTSVVTGAFGGGGGAPRWNKRHIRPLAPSRKDGRRQFRARWSAKPQAAGPLKSRPLQ